ncbi:hypothetical protein [Burkholderia stagnalis]|uniref:DUF2190 family protein n=1 Tax=Burkholderia stagnalis TaxID=1503054 RepID=A0A106PDB5_9BURK|nr:hypothetical protein [Burkholderia stagnalis]KVZ05914.1 hypothetical protein WT35_24290 [Burkholderia stagnalis]KWA50568.1 hypothetical protein WT43_29155 [Burkholderia stagnalis]KWA61698.1 hypothetical protein WT42_02970 [Burkholderia stagnalis]KWA66079.1 hypothetical protein WT44_07555 [Burkholderia stagnalis]KWD04192.1 hypothetical protein WT46_14110 [Burkholderia stagnalis]
MSEINTAQAAKLIAGKKLSPHEQGGRKRILASKMPDAYAQLEIGDTVFIGRVPVGSRFTLNSVVGCAAGRASALFDIGARSSATGVVIAADGIAAGVNVAAAGVKPANTGVLIVDGAEYITNEIVDVFATVRGAPIAANQAIKFEIEYVTD